MTRAIRPPHPRGLLDTSVFVAIEQDREVDYGALPVEQYVSSISRGELLAGVLSAQSTEVRAQRLSTIEYLASLSNLNVDYGVAARWAKLRTAVASFGRKVNVNDLWIAAVALEHNLPVVTRDGDFDVFAEYGGPEVIRV
ncbi:MAG: PIN domain-containing protein [Cryobacterium sp.]|nr:PIN domain-containing protein [Cryobacterium sp.]